MTDLLERLQTPTVPVQGAYSHEQVEEVGCAPKPRRCVEPKPCGQLIACQTACTAIMMHRVPNFIACLEVSRCCTQQDCMAHQHMLVLDAYLVPCPAG